MPPTDRRPRWRQAVFKPRPGLSHAHRVVLLYLAEHMDSKGIVSVPRTKLAADLGLAPARISEAVNAGKRHGFLDTVRRARPGVTAVYQAIIPRAAEVRDSYPSDDGLEVRQTGPLRVRNAYPYEGSRGTPQQYPSSGSATQGVSPPADLTSRRAATTRTTTAKESEASA